MQNSFSAYFLLENASQIGLSIPEEVVPLFVPGITIPKTSEWQRAAIKSGVQGAEPRPSFSPFLGRNGDPRRAGGATGRCAPRHRKSPDHPKGTQYPTAPPAPGTGREPTSQGLTCGSPEGPPIGSPQSKRRAPKALSFYTLQGNDYCATSSQNRMRMVAICAREALPAGFRVPSSMPWMMFSATAQAIAGWA